MMSRLSRRVGPATVIAIAVIAGGAARADDGRDQNEPNRYVVTNLTADLPGVAPNTDPVLQNSWGVAFSPGASPFWIADNATGCSTLYDGTGLPQPQPTPLQVKIPLPGGVIPNTACVHVNPPTSAEPHAGRTDRHGMESNHKSNDGIPGSWDQPAGGIHLGYRGWNDFRLGRWSNAARSGSACRG